MSEQNIIVEMLKVYVSDLSVEVPHAPDIFQHPLEQAPEVNLGLGIEVQKQEDPRYYEVKLKLTVTSKAEERVLYLVEASQSAVMQIEGVGEQDLATVLNIAVPSMLFPYAAETISNSINRAGFPPLFLKPINFEALYQQRLAQENTSSESDGNDTVQ